MSKLDELLAELDEEIINYETVTLTRREYDLLRSALRERKGKGKVMVPISKRLAKDVLSIENYEGWQGLLFKRLQRAMLTAMKEEGK